MKSPPFGDASTVKFKYVAAVEGGTVKICTFIGSAGADRFPVDWAYATAQSETKAIVNLILTDLRGT